MENINEILKELESSISKEKKKKNPKNDDGGRTQGRILGTLMASEFINAGYELQLSYAGINQVAEVTLRNIPCGNDPRIFLDRIKDGILPVIGISRENVTVKITYDEGFNRH
jgi:hypothetical protein